MGKKLSKEDQQTMADLKYWRGMCPEGFYLIGFTYRHAASFGVEGGGGSFEITNNHIKFFGQGKNI